MRKGFFVVLTALLVFLLCAAANSQGRDRVRPGKQQPSFGITVSDVPAGSAVSGAYVQSVTPGSPAEAIGLLSGDIITNFDGNAIGSWMLVMRLVSLVSGTQHNIVVWRGGQEVHLGSGGGVSSSKGSSLGVAISDVPSEWGIVGAFVKEVAPGSPAEAAGIIVGDVITEIDGARVTNPADLTKAVGSLTKDRTCSMSVRRGDRVVTLYPILRDSSAGEKASTAVSRTVNDINVLKYAFIDPKTRTVTLVGKYDPTYPTGPIPYYDLLNDAIKSPYASFSLEPTAATRNSVDRANDAIEKDVARMYSDPNYCNEFAAKLMNLIANDPSLGSDREHFRKKLADAFGVSADDADQMMKLLAGDKSQDPSKMGPMFASVMRGIGFNDVAEAITCFFSGGDEVVKGFDALGVRDQFDAIKSAFQRGEKSGDQASAEVQVLFWSAILRDIKVAESEIDNYASSVVSGQMTLDNYLNYAGGKLTSTLTDTVGLKLFNTLTLSDDLLSKLYLFQTPQMDLVFTNVPSDSVLGSVLFRADFMLKTLCTSPDTRDKVPEHLTSQEFLYQASVKNGVVIPGDMGAEVGHRLVPGEVKMRVSPDGSVVSFGDAEVKVVGWLIKEPFGKRKNPAAAELIQKSVGDYANFLTEHYDDYAKVMPELHRMREAAKLIALERWAKKNNYNLVVDRAYNLKSSLPKTTSGFWQAVFTADKQQFSLTVIAEGGASFGQDEGEAWVQPAVDPTVADTVCKQLAYSSVLAKNAAAAAIDGDMDAARDLAEKSARAMTGDLDLTQLPQLAGTPSFTDPASQAQLSAEALSVTEDSLKALDAVHATMDKAAEIENTSPADAQALRAAAAKAQQEADDKLKELRDAMNEAQQTVDGRNSAIVTIHSLNDKPVEIAGLVAPGQKTSVASSGTATTAPTTTVAQTEPGISDLPLTQRQKWAAELDAVGKEIESTKAQLLKLNKSIQSDQQQYKLWENETQTAMDKCRDVYFDLFMDAAVGGMSDRYDQMSELANKLPNKPGDLIEQLGRTSDELHALSGAKTWKDLIEWAGKDANTLPEKLEKVRDGVSQILAITELDKTPPGALWKYGSSIIDLTYGFAQYCTAYDGVNQMDKNNDSYVKALAALTKRMDALVAKSKDLKTKLAVPEADN